MGGSAHLGSEVCRHHCPPDTGHLCVDHEAWQPLSPTRPSPPTHFPTLSCQKQPRPSALRRAFSGACLGGPQRSFCRPVSGSRREMAAECPDHSLALAGSPQRTHPQTSLLQTECFAAFLPPLLPFSLPAAPLPHSLSCGFLLYAGWPGASLQAHHSGTLCPRGDPFPQADSTHCLCPH